MKKFASQNLHVHTKIVSPWKADISPSKNSFALHTSSFETLQILGNRNSDIGRIANGIASFTPVIYKLIVDSITQLTAHSGSYDHALFLAVCLCGHQCLLGLICGAQ
jgi:hypothetical protein